MNFGVGGFGRRGRPGGRGEENCDRRRIMMGLPKIGGGARRGQHPRTPAGLERGGRPGRPARVRGPGRHHRQGSAGNAPITARGRTRSIWKSGFVWETRRGRPTTTSELCCRGLPWELLGHSTPAWRRTHQATNSKPPRLSGRPSTPSTTRRRGKCSGSATVDRAECGEVLRSRAVNKKRRAEALPQQD